MGRFYWKSRKTWSIAILALILFIFIRKGNYIYKSVFSIPNSKPYIVWEYVSDFSHMKFLNPTIKDFTILSDTWQNGNWHYTVQYSENLSHWPYSPNLSTAYITIKGDQKSDEYLIESTHSTCLFFGFYCLDSTSVFRFTADLQNYGTNCEETVYYECPVFLSSFCLREVEYQRNAISSNLQTIFKPKL